ncbi:hypothetical protein C8R47DRAFT_1187836 [Mycena vitilis]|nr:hypothetical protein C8R47DRAFT_1187836 [Mycena vitilis]
MKPLSGNHSRLLRTAHMVLLDVSSCPPGSKSSETVLPLPDNLRHSATLIKITVEAITTSQYLRALFRNALNEIATAHLENEPRNNIDPEWYLFNWEDWLQAEPLHVHVSTANVKWGWRMRREVTPGRKFNILWDLAYAASNGPGPRPPLSVWPWPIPSPLPRVYFEFCVVLVTIHECFHLLNYRNFAEYDTPRRLPDGNAGIAAELAFFKGRILTEWDVGHVGDFRYLCGLYLKTPEGDVTIGKYRAHPCLIYSARLIRTGRA